jgi:hypothetical protein
VNFSVLLQKSADVFKQFVSMVIPGELVNSKKFGVNFFLLV